MFDAGSLLPVAGAAVGGYFGGSPGAMLGSSLGGAIGGSLTAGAGTRRAQGMSAQAQADAIAAQQEGLGGALGQLSAYKGTGERALSAQEQMAMDGGRFEIPPELAAQYDIEREDADRYANRLGATRGNLFSGAAMELAANQRRRIGARQSAEGYRAGLERSKIQYGRLSDLSRMGYGAAGQGAQAELATGSNIADLYSGGGTERAGMELGNTQANLDIIGNVTEAIGGGIASYYAQPRGGSVYGSGSSGGRTSSGGNIYDPSSIRLGY